MLYSSYKPTTISRHVTSIHLIKVHALPAAEAIQVLIITLYNPKMCTFTYLPDHNLTVSRHVTIVH